MILWESSIRNRRFFGHAITSFFHRGGGYVRSVTSHKRLGRILFVVLLCVFLLPVAALADGPELWVEGCVPSSEGGVDGVCWWYSQQDRQYYLFLPACADPSQLTVHFSGAENLTIDGTAVTNGEAFAFTAGQSVTVTLDGRDYPLSIMQSANVSALLMETESGSLSYIHKRKGNKESGTLLMADKDGSILYNGALKEIKGRGNATFQYNKKPYQIKLSDKTDLLGMGKHKTWVLLANFHDNSLLRNTLTFQMARAAGMAYTPRSAFCDVYINREYLGTYELCTKVQIDEERLDIADLEKATEEANGKPLDEYPKFGYTNAEKGRRKGRSIPNDPEDITGGYLLELEYANRYSGEASGYTTKKGQPIVIKSPEYASEAQTLYISQLLQSIENGLRARDGVDTTTGKHYSELIDMDSFVKKYLIEEIVKNYDANKSSQYFYKPADSVSTKLFAGPVWDYDSSYGNYEGSRKRASATVLKVCKDYGQSYYWYPAAYRQEDFRWRAQELYATVFKPILEAMLSDEPGTEELRTLSELESHLESSAAMNFTRWPVFNNPARSIQTGADYAENIQYIRTFLTQRMAFLEEEWVIPYEKGEVAAEP